jgi:hypothetical protein
MQTTRHQTQICGGKGQVPLFLPSMGFLQRGVPLLGGNIVTVTINGKLYLLCHLVVFQSDAFGHVHQVLTFLRGKQKSFKDGPRSKGIVGRGKQPQVDCVRYKAETAEYIDLGVDDFDRLRSRGVGIACGFGVTVDFLGFCRRTLFLAVLLRDGAVVAVFVEDELISFGAFSCSGSSLARNKGRINVRNTNANISLTTKLCRLLSKSGGDSKRYASPANTVAVETQ